jgi:hypothetical protein
MMSLVFIRQAAVGVEIICSLSAHYFYLKQQHPAPAARRRR